LLTSLPSAARDIARTEGIETCDLTVTVDGRPRAARGIARTEGIETQSRPVDIPAGPPAARGIARTEGIETFSRAPLLRFEPRPRAASPAPRALKRGWLVDFQAWCHRAARGIARTEGIETGDQPLT